MIGLDKILLSSIGGSFITILINELIKSYNRKKKIKKTGKVLIQFIDQIIIKYLETNLLGYDSLLAIKDDEKYYESRRITMSPMLNKNIFDFFDKDDLILLSNSFQKKTITDLYHSFYEIDFLQENSYWKLIKDFLEETQNHFETHKEENEDFFEHIKWCENYKDAKSIFISRMQIQREHTQKLIDEFKEIKKEISEIDIIEDW